MLGVNPIQHLLAPTGVLAQLPAASQAALTGRHVLPRLLSGPFHSGLIVVFSVSAALSVLAGLASLLRGKRNAGAAGEFRTGGGQRSRAGRRAHGSAPAGSVVVGDRVGVVAGLAFPAPGLEFLEFLRRRPSPRRTRRA